MNAATVFQDLRKGGFRLTTARKLIVEEVFRSTKPFSAADMHAFLRRKGTATSQVTVYRELSFLEERGILQGSTFQDGVRRYCLASVGHHHHLICTGCDDVQDVHIDHLENVERAIEKQKRFRIRQHVLEFYGLCEKCE